MMRSDLRRVTTALGIALLLAAGPAAAADYRLGISDRVKIKVQEWPDLAGEYMVTPDGMVSLPLIGNVKVVGLRLDDLAQEISDRLQRRSEGAERPLAAVEIAQYRPFTILGDVQRPGEYPYRPDLTVLEAVSIAGGYYRPELGLLRLGRDVAASSGELRTLSLRLKRLLAREARLTASLAGREDVPLPLDFANQKDDPTISEIMRNEQGILNVENDMLRSEREALDKIKSLYQTEINSLRGQVQALTQEQGTIQDQVKQFRSLASKGLGIAPTLFALERSLAQVVNEQMSTETAIVKAQESTTVAEQHLEQVVLERSRLNTRDLQQTREEIADTHAKIRTQRELLNEAEISAPREARERQAQHAEHSAFTIIRKNGDTVEEVAADETTLVAPNDVIKVPVNSVDAQVSDSSLNVSRAKAFDRAGR
jgi:exopolysaccharide production protein ExoF